MTETPSQSPPSILCRPYLVDFAELADRVRAFGNDVRLAVDDLPPEPLPTYERIAQQQFLECLDALHWQDGSDAHQETRGAARALFDRLFWSWRGEDLRIVELDVIPYALDSAWADSTTAIFAELWRELAPAFTDLREPFDRAVSAGELTGSFSDFVRYAKAWGDALLRGAAEGRGLIVVQFESTGTA